MGSSGDMGDAVIAFKNLQNPDRASMTVSFALRYLNTFAKGSIITDKVKLCFSQSMPLLVSFSNAVVSLGFYLAPKIDDDMNDV
jgi:proliferating cell nuclear antigen